MSKKISFESIRGKKKLKALKTVFVVLILLVSLIITYGSKFLSFVPNWNSIYAFFGLATSSNFQVYDEPLVVTFIDVGQGDSSFVRAKLSSGAYCNILIDAGESGNEDKIRSILDAYNVTELSYVIATHPHSDHVGSMAYVLQYFKSINYVYHVATEIPVEISNELSKTNCISVGAGENIKIDKDLELQILSPSKEYDNENDMSLVVRLVYKNNSFLFTGDAEQSAEYGMLSGEFEGKWTLKSDVLKVAHHGSDSSSSEDFISAVSPSFAIISCGKNNDYGHPHEQTLKTLSLYGSRILRTDKTGTITVCSNGNNIIYKENS